MTELDPLALLHPVTAQWFRERFGAPTEVQAAAWPRIAAGAHVLATAPTGSGKTLAAFLLAVDRLLTGQWPGGRTRVLYISPLKALAADVERNLTGPLVELGAALDRAGISPAAVRVATRTGDTGDGERRRMVRQPPEILATTPESLSLLLLSHSGRSMLGGVRLLILDEIHAVVPGRRGLQLALAVERLTRLAGEFQRLALSATVTPLSLVARSVAGARVTGLEGEARFAPREIELIEARGDKRIELEVVSFLGRHEVARSMGSTPEAPPTSRGGPADEDPFWQALRADLASRIARNRSSLVFANSRRMTERLTRLLNQDQPTERAYSHHGSLSREVRQVVERRFKDGQLPAIVATSSLELGIDIGALDEVLLVQTPPSVASAIQRVGRAGHQVGAVSRGRLYPSHPHDLLLAAVVGEAMVRGEIEPTVPAGPALDVLAQALLAECLDGPVPLDELFDRVRTAAAFRDLPRHHFDLVVDMLAGRFAETRVRELAPRLLVDGNAGTAEARRGTRRLLAQSGGTIPDRGHYRLRLAGSLANLGQLDEEFVWERSIGDAFVLGAQTWRIVEINHHDVVVAPGQGEAPLAPFWRAESPDRPVALARRLRDVLLELEVLIEGSAPPGPAEQADPLAAALAERFPLAPDAAGDLAALLRRQRAATGAPLPHRRHLLIEELRDPGRGDQHTRLLLHTGWGGGVNRPFALALAAAWERRCGAPLGVVHDDDVVLIEVPGQLETDELLALVDLGSLDELVRERLPRSGYFGARFREIAQVAMLLPRGDARRRVPLWLNRQRAKKLLEAVAGQPEFPLTLETWRSCLAEGCDLDALREELAALASGEIEISRRVTAKPSPLASNVIWQQTNLHMYDDDTPEGSGARLGSDLLAGLLHASGQALVPAAVVAELAAKLDRTAAGWAPAWGAELVAWLEERVALTPVEWDQLRAAVERDHGPATPEATHHTAERLARLRPAERELLVAASAVGRLDRALASDGEPGELLGEWLLTRPPVALDELTARFGHAAVTRAVRELVEEGVVVCGHFLEGVAEQQIADRENLERLVRLARARRRPDFEARPLAELPLFLATWQGLVGDPQPGPDAVLAALDRLRGYAVPAALLEGELLPSRLLGYQPGWLDAALEDGTFVWTGAGRARVVMLRTDELDLVEPGAASDRRVLARLEQAPARATELADQLALPLPEVAAALWRLVWSGRATTDDLGELRRGIVGGFREVAGSRPGTQRAPLASRGRRREALDRFRAAWGAGSRWLALPLLAADESLDALETLELDKARARVVLARYGIVFRELLAREGGIFGWGRLFRALRLMELSGEILSGVFFADLPGPQFALPSAFARLGRGLAGDAGWWCSALDPAAPCGLALPRLAGLPRRLAGNAVAWRGCIPVVLVERGGRRLAIRLEPDDPALDGALAPLINRFARLVNPEASLTVETINGESAADSAWRPALARHFEVTRSGPALRLWRRWAAS